MSELKIDPEFQQLIPPLGVEELQQLEANIRQDGCRDPLVVWNGILIDGHNRYEICTAKKIAFQVVEKKFDNRSLVIEWIIRNQFGRRNLVPYVRTQLALRLEDEIKKRAKVNQVASGKEFGKGKQKSAEPIKQIETRKEIAKVANVSHDTVAKVKVIEKKAPKEIKQKLATGKVSINEAYQEIKKQEKKVQLEKKKAEIIQQSKGDAKENPPKVWLQDCITFLESQKAYDLLITDPPYSTDVEDIGSFASSWLPLALSKLKSTGRAYIFIGAYPAELKAYLDVAMPEQVLVWTYRNTLGPSPSDNYKLNWQAILYYKGDKCPNLDCPIMLEQFSVQDINAPDGRQGDRYHAWQKPIEIAERFIRHSTDPGDVVCDPFTCTGTFLIAASKLGRVGVGCDISEDNLAIALERGCIYG